MRCYGLISRLQRLSEKLASSHQIWYLVLISQRATSGRVIFLSSRMLFFFLLFQWLSTSKWLIILNDSREVFIQSEKSSCSRSWSKSLWESYFCNWPNIISFWRWQLDTLFWIWWRLVFIIQSWYMILLFFYTFLRLTANCFFSSKLSIFSHNPW